MEKHKQHNFKIVLTGPESSGKTRLAGALAESLGTIWSPEFARFYLASLGRPYTREDLQTIGRGQRAWEQWHSEQAGTAWICDTDWTVLQVWEHYRFGPSETWHWQKGYGAPLPADLYLLCAPDFPPEPDPLRENPGERDHLFEWYWQLLHSKGLNYLVLRGEHERRLETALAEIRKLFGTL